MKTYCPLVLLLVLLAACHDQSPAIPPRQLVPLNQRIYQANDTMHPLPADSVAIDPQPRPNPTDRWQSGGLMPNAVAPGRRI